MKISKSKLIALIEQSIDEMAMDFDTPDRPHQNVTRDLEIGNTPFKKVPLPSTGREPNQNFQELLASERYKQIVQKVRQYTGLNVPLQSNLPQLSGMMMMAHRKIVSLEQNHRRELERLAVDLVKKEMGIPEGAINFDAKIIGLGEIDTSKYQMSSDEEQNETNLEIEEDLMNDLESLNMEKAKRRLINAIMQGASKRGHYMYHYVSDEISNIVGDDQIINLYGILMSINDSLYWQLSNEDMKMMMSGPGGHGGQEEVDRNTNPPTVKARGVNFPILVHELIKGVMEIFAIQGRPQDDEGSEDEETWSKISKSEDTLDAESWDLRLGPAIWDRIRMQFPEDILTDENKAELQNYLLTAIFKLEARKFLVFMKEVINGTQTGKRLMNELMDGINQMFQEQDYEESINQFQDDLDDVSDSTDDDELDDFLSQFGITRPDDDE